MEKVLIADNDAQLLMILTDSLEKYRKQFEVVTVRNGLEAILALQKHAYAAVVTEIRMPKVNGLVLMGYLAKNYPDTPCIVMTDVYSDALRKRLEQNSIQCIEKPFKIRDLAEAILAVLDRKETFSGKLKGIPLLGFLTLIENEGLSCVCEVSSLKGGKGFFMFKEGVLQNAVYGKVVGEPAAKEMLAMNEATIKYRSLPQQSIPHVIRHKISELASMEKD